MINHGSNFQPIQHEQRGLFAERDEPGADLAIDISLKGKAATAVVERPIEVYIRNVQTANLTHSGQAVGSKRQEAEIANINRIPSQCGEFSVGEHSFQVASIHRPDTGETAKALDTQMGAWRFADVVTLDAPVEKRLKRNFDALDSSRRQPFILRRPIGIIDIFNGTALQEYEVGIYFCGPDPMQRWTIEKFTEGVKPLPVCDKRFRCEPLCFSRYYEIVDGIAQVEHMKKSHVPSQYADSSRIAYGTGRIVVDSQFGISHLAYAVHGGARTFSIFK